MMELVVNQVIIPVLVAIIAIILEIARRQLRNYLSMGEELMDKQKEALLQNMSIERYNRDKQYIKDIVLAIEQLGNELGWEGTLKHSKVLETVEGKTRLSDDEIYNIIKASVAEINIHKNAMVAEKSQDNIAQ